ncbi:MAG: hypothetical protein WBB27_02570 [Maribacter sp.]
MNRRFKITILSCTILCLGLVYLYFEFHRSAYSEIAKKEVETYVSSQKLLSVFATNEDLANTIYVEKLIQVEGTIKEITFFNNRYTILLKGKDDYSYVLCDMLPTEKDVSQKLKPNDKVRLKGICKGYLMDVVLLNCVLVKKETNE